MNKKTLIIPFFIFSITLSAQIKILDSKSLSNMQQFTEKPLIEKFDSLRDFRDLDYNNDKNMKYIGQKLFIMPHEAISYALRKNSFENKENAFIVLQSGYYTIKNIIIWPRMDDSKDTSFIKTDIYKYFRLLDTQTKTKTIGLNQFYVYNGGPYFELTSDKNEILYVNSMNCGPFISVGFFEKVQRTYEGKELICNSGTRQTDAITRKTIEIEPGTKFKCTSVALKDIGTEAHVLAILENNDGNISMDIGSLKFSRDLSLVGSYQRIEDIQRIEKLNVMSEQERIKQQKAQIKIESDRQMQHLNSCISIYGKENGTSVAEGKISIGMNTLMCKEAWGSPADIRQTTTSLGTNEVWIYSEKYKLYFTDGILKMIKN